MVEMMVRGATGVLGSVIGRLAALLAERYQLAKDVKRGILSLQDELSTMDAIVRMLADKDDEQIDPLDKDWRNLMSCPTTTRLHPPFHAQSEPWRLKRPCKR